MIDNHMAKEKINFKSNNSEKLSITGTNWSIFRSLGIPFVRLAIGIFVIQTKKKVHIHLF